jgi:hypothetical protein
MQNQEFARSAHRRNCRCGVSPRLADLLRDPMTMALMDADRVDRRELDALVDWARDSLRVRFRD